MQINEVISEINKLGNEVLEYDKLLENIILLKKDYAQKGKESDAKKLWICEQIVQIHKDYNEAFSLLVNGRYFDSWCKLEKIEITFHLLKPHFSFAPSQFKLGFIERAVKNLQIIFPYRLFSSVELLEKEKKCNICNRTISIRNACGHRVGEIYGGELCLRIVTKSEILGIAIVENPVNKYTVLFTSDSKTKKTIDQYNYDTIEYFLNLIKTPYEPWDLKIFKKYYPHSNYSHIGHDDLCPCISGNKYKDCCLLKKGVKYFHYEFLVKEETAAIFMNKSKRLT